MDITPKQMEELAAMARLTLEPGERAALQGRLEELVGYLRWLDRVDGDAPGQDGGEAPLRPDQVAAHPAGEALLDQAPRTRAGYILTPGSRGEEAGR